MIPLTCVNQGSPINRDRKQNGGCQELREWKVRIYCLMDIEFQFGKIKRCGDGRLCWLHNIVNVFNATVLFLLDPPTFIYQASIHNGTNYTNYLIFCTECSDIWGLFDWREPSLPRTNTFLGVTKGTTGGVSSACKLTSHLRSGSDTAEGNITNKNCLSHPRARGRTTRAHPYIPKSVKIIPSSQS